MAKTVWHVAGAKYDAGDPLLPWETLVEMGVLTADDWHWDDAPEGFDGEVVCVYETESEAIEHAADFGGTIVTVTIPDDYNRDDPMLYSNSFGGYLSPRSERVFEGHLAFRGGIPAEWIAAGTTNAMSRSSD